jgi:hypothetical protein
MEKGHHSRASDWDFQAGRRLTRTAPRGGSAPSQAVASDELGKERAETEEMVRQDKKSPHVQRKSVLLQGKS